MRRKGLIMTSEKMRGNPLFMRNGFDVAGRWEIPVIRKQIINFGSNYSAPHPKNLIDLT